MTDTNPSDQRTVPMSVVEQMQAQHEQLAEDKTLADREITRLRREVAAVKRILADERQSEPFAEKIRTILAEWKRVNKKGPKVNVEAGGDRWERVRSWLKKYPHLQDHIDAIHGQHHPSHSWWVEHGKTDIKYVYKDQDWFEKFRDAGEQLRTGAVEEPARPALRVVKTTYEMRVCPECAGTGKDTDQPCFFCQGRGEISTEPEGFDRDALRWFFGEDCRLPYVPWSRDKWSRPPQEEEKKMNLLRLESENVALLRECESVIARSERRAA